MARKITKTRPGNVTIRKKKRWKAVSETVNNFMLQEYQKTTQLCGLDYLEEIFRI